MPRQKGTPKTGGRKKGTPNKITRDVREFVERIFTQADPEKTALALLRSKNVQAKTGMFIRLLDHYYGKPKQGIEMSGPDGAAMKIENMSEAEIDARLKVLLEKYQQEKKT